jgi:ribosomal-protein-alanine N-acetyltransferase
MQLNDLDQVLTIDQMSFSMPWPLNAYRYELNENPLSLLWVAETRLVDGIPGAPRIIGMIVVWLVLDEAHIATIAVHPEYRRQGIARLLLKTALLESARHDMRSATLEVRSGNLPAQRLYQRFHFEIVGRRPRYYRDNNEDALIMTVDNLEQALVDQIE